MIVKSENLRFFNDIIKDINFLEKQEKDLELKSICMVC